MLVLLLLVCYMEAAHVHVCPEMGIKACRWWPDPMMMMMQSHRFAISPASIELRVMDSQLQLRVDAAMMQPGMCYREEAAFACVRYFEVQRAHYTAPDWLARHRDDPYTDDMEGLDEEYYTRLNAEAAQFHPALVSLTRLHHVSLVRDAGEGILCAAADKERRLKSLEVHSYALDLDYGGCATALTVAQPMRITLCLRATEEREDDGYEEIGGLNVMSVRLECCSI